MAEELKEEGTDLSGMDATLDETMKGLSVTEDGGQEPSETPAPAPRSPPKAWKPEMHEFWPKLDPKVQEYLELRESEVQSGFEKHKSAADFGRRFQETLNPYLPDLQSRGLDPYAAVGILLNAERTLRTGDDNAKLQMFMKLAKDYGVDPSRFSAEQPYIDPALAEVKTQLQNLTTSINSERQAQINSLRSEIDKEVTTFFADTKAHPHAEEVADHILLLLQDPRNTLETAYEQAIYANPTTRAKELERLSKEAAEKLKSEKALEAEEAKRKRGTIIKGSHEGSTKGEKLGSMEDTLKGTLREIKERA